jgi:hypothetical protein
VQDMGYLICFSIGGEHTSSTPSDARGWLLRASVENLMVDTRQSVRGQIRAPFAGEMGRRLRCLSSSGIESDWLCQVRER